MPDENYIQILKKNLLNRYENITGLPENEKQEILHKLYKIKEIEYSNYRMKELAKAGFGQEASLEERKINSLYAEIQNHSFSKLNGTNIKNTSNLKEKIQTVLDFMKQHVQRVGREQAIKDFQYGLNILNRNRKINKLKIDGDYGIKTNACITYLCKFYSPRVICKSIRNAAITNAIFDTKNDRRINTEKRIENISNDLNIGRGI